MLDEQRRKSSAALEPMVQQGRPHEAQRGWCGHAGAKDATGDPQRFLQNEDIPLKECGLCSDKSIMRPKGSPAKLESRRRTAAKMLAKGQGIREVARRIGAAPSSVKRWKDALEDGGVDALRSKPHTGRPSRLTRQQRQQLSRILEKGPRAAKVRAESWTCVNVGKLIRRQFGVRYHPDHVSRILRALGWKYRLVRTKSRNSRANTAKRQWVKA